jgi:hypothetical protein
VTPGEAKLKLWAEPGRGILRFVADNFHITPDSWQQQALELFSSPKKADRRISLQACAGPGKSAVLSWCGWWFLATQASKGEHPKGIATSITGDNLKANLWAEFAKWQQRSPFLIAEFEWTAKRIACRDFRETWFLEARPFPKTANADQQGQTFSGLHAKYVLCLIDESGGVPTTMLRAAEQALTNCDFGKILQAGNPISLDGCLHAAATKLRAQWHVIRITGDPDDPDRSTRVDIDNARLQIETYGRDNPWVKAYILGQFPPASINAIFSVDDVEAAMLRKFKPEAYAYAQKRLGVDVARFGDDRSTICPRQGVRTGAPGIMRNADTVAIAERVAMTAVKLSVELILVDDTGHWGHGVIDNLRRWGYPASGVVFSDKAIDPRYFNRRAEMYMTFADWLRGGGGLPNVPELVAELTQITYTFHKGAILLEDKDQLKKRIGSSPDIADGYALTFALPDMPAKLSTAIGGSAGVGKVATDFDPYR